MKSKKQVVQELSAESDGLSLKIDRLTNFLQHRHTGVSDEQKHWMNVQLYSMKNYLGCLRKRIEDLEAEK